MKKTILLALFLSFFTSLYAKKEYIQFTTVTALGGIRISGNLPEPFKQYGRKGELDERDLQKMLGQDIYTAFPTKYAALILNFLADYGYELQQAFVDKNGEYTYIMVRDTEK